MQWAPHVTVAAIAQDSWGRFLLVEEEAEGRRCFNQPAGHWEKGETLSEAVVRETLEETGFRFLPQYLVGVYHWTHPRRDLVYLRFAFAGDVDCTAPAGRLDAGIIGPVWMDLTEICSREGEMRSSMVERCIRDFLQGQRFPLDLVRSV